MYASVATNHRPLENPDVRAHDQNGRYIVVAHLDHNVYLSFEPQEARLLADALVAAAEKADQAQARIDALTEAELH